MSRKVLFIVGLFLFPLSACADVLVFKSGKTVEGVITDVTPTGITFESGSDILGVSYTQISEVRASEGGRVKNTLLVDKARTYLPPKRPKSGTANLKKVDLYMTTWCGYCKQTVMFLNQNNIYYTAYDIEKDAAAAKIYREYGGQGVPVVVVADKTVIKGYNPSAIIAALK